ncbi:hypothetical protein [Rhodopila sp.]|uniref:hypothetical protein n=1 Tax=Rhodopila sp. TaxID=2480087 RepID=UPI003D0A685B
MMPRNRPLGRQAGRHTETSWAPAVNEKGRPPAHERRPEEFDQQEHQSKPRHSEQSTRKTDRGKSRLAKAKGELKDLLKGSIKITVKITITITITLGGVGVAANNRHVEQIWTDLGRSYPVPMFAAEIVNVAHKVSHSAFAFALAKPIHDPPIHHSTTGYSPAYEPPPPLVHTAPESWCVQTKSIWASNPAFFPALPIELRENNCQHWGISAP